MSRKADKISYTGVVVQSSCCAAILVLSSWITIPIYIGITLQTLALFVISYVMKPKVSLLTVLSYIFLGVCGIPVFSGFGSGISAVLGPGGGFILGFLLVPILIAPFRNLARNNILYLFLPMLVSLAILYVCGTAWYAYVYGTADGISFFAAVSVCVIPFILPDIIKILLAAVIIKRLQKTSLFVV